MLPVSRTILVMGASSGIGRATARLLLEQGHTVIGTSRDTRQFKVEHPRFKTISIDLAQLDTLPKKAKSIEKACPELDAVVFAAGFGQFGSLEEFSYAQIEALMNVNFTGVVYLTRALLPKLKQKASSDLIYIGSEAALKGSRKGSIYCASKFALRGFTQALREEGAKSSTRVGLINPGMVKTEFFANLSFEPSEEQEHHLLAQDVAEAASYILNSSHKMVIDEINLNPLHKVVKFKK